MMESILKMFKNLFKEKFVEKRLLDRHCVVELMKNFEQTGNVPDRPRSGHSSVITNEALQDVRSKLNRSLQKSLRRLLQVTGMSFMSIHKAVKLQKFFPNKVDFVHELKAQEIEKRVIFCRCFQQFIDTNEKHHERILLY